MKKTLLIIAGLLLPACFLSAALTEHWGFDGNTVSEPRSLNLPAYFGATYTADENGVPNGAISFNGTNYLRSSTFNDTAIYGAGYPLVNTVRIVFKIDDLSDISIVHSTYDSSSYDGYNLFSITVEAGNGRLQIGSRTSNPYHVGWGLTGPELTAGQFYHVVIRWDQAAQTAALFVDGVKYDTVSGTIVPTRPYTDGGALYVGTQRFQGSTQYQMIGAVSDLAYYDHAWTDAEVEADYGNWSGGGGDDDCCSALADQIATLQQTVNQNTLAISAATDAISALSGEVAALSTALSGVEGDVSVITNAVSQVEQSLLDLEGVVGAHTVTLGDLAGTANGLQSAVDSLNDSLSALNEKVDELHPPKGKSKKSQKSSKSKKSDKD